MKIELTIAMIRVSTVVILTLVVNGGIGIPVKVNRRDVEAYRQGCQNMQGPPGPPGPQGLPGRLSYTDVKEAKRDIQVELETIIMMRVNETLNHFQKLSGCICSLD